MYKITILFFVFHFFLPAYHAYVIKPVADVYITNPLDHYGKEWKKFIPENMYSATPNSIIIRSSQVFFNTVCEVLVDDENDIVKIKVPGYFYLEKNGLGSYPSNIFWIRKEDICSLEKIDKKFHFLIPQNIMKSNNKKHIAVLNEPSRISHISFSAGTRFVVLNTFKNNSVVNYYTPDRGLVSGLVSNKSLFFPTDFDKTESSYRHRFIHLMYKWITFAGKFDGVFPYVWGGASILNVVKLPFCETALNKISGTAYHWNDLNTFSVPTGVDCSTLVMLAAQIAGLPFYLRNTTMQRMYLDDVQNEIKLGDLIVWKGHVCVLDSERNIVIQSRGYESGYGRLYRAPLNRVFEDINTCDDLLNAYKNNIPLKLLGINGVVRTVITDYKLCSLISAFATLRKLFIDAETMSS